MSTRTISRNELLCHFVQYLIGTHAQVRILVDARSAFCTVPKQYKHDHQLSLDIGRNLPRPIPDLYVVLSGISATLSFNGTPSKVFIPWSAVTMAAGGDDACRFRPDASQAVLDSERATVPKVKPKGRPRNPSAKDRAKRLGIKRIK